MTSNALKYQHYHLIRCHFASNILNSFLSCGYSRLFDTIFSGHRSIHRKYCNDMNEWLKALRRLTSTRSTSAFVFFICSVCAFKCMFVSNPTSSIFWTSCAPLLNKKNSFQYAIAELKKKSRTCLRPLQFHVELLWPAINTRTNQSSACCLKDNCAQPFQYFHFRASPPVRLSSLPWLLSADLFFSPPL